MTKSSSTARARKAHVRRVRRGVSDACDSEGATSPDEVVS